MANSDYEIRMQFAVTDAGWGDVQSLVLLEGNYTSAAFCSCPQMKGAYCSVPKEDVDLVKNAINEYIQGIANEEALETGSRSLTPEENKLVRAILEDPEGLTPGEIKEAFSSFIPNRKD